MPILWCRGRSQFFHVSRIRPFSRHSVSRTTQQLAFGTLLACFIQMEGTITSKVHRLLHGYLLYKLGGCETRRNGFQIPKRLVSPSPRSARTNASTVSEQRYGNTEMTTYRSHTCKENILISSGFGSGCNARRELLYRQLVDW
jgi:hypothetical protein